MQGHEEQFPRLSLGRLVMWVGVPRLSELEPALLQLVMPFLVLVWFLPCFVFVCLVGCFSDMIALS